MPAVKLSPAMDQYMRFKRQHPDAILFFRMGDFYEMFFDDAVEASSLLGLTLTSRNHGRTSGAVPLAGFPHHAAESYLAKLVQMGRKVAICEQVEDARKAKGIVKRDVVQVVSPGTTLSDTMLDSRRNNFIACLSTDGENGTATTAGMAIVDLSTGDFSVEEMPVDDLADELERLAPTELLLSETADESFVSTLRRRLPLAAVSRIDPWQFEYRTAYDTLTEQLHVHSLKGFDCEDLDLGVRASGAAIAYLKEAQRGAIEHVSGLRRRRQNDGLLIDATAQRNLDLLVNQQDGTRAGSLLDIVDQTLTPMGARLLRQWLTTPLADIAPITQRLDCVDALGSKRSVRKSLGDLLGGVGDLERSMARICCRRANARDLVGLSRSLSVMPDVGRFASSLDSDLMNHLVAEDMPPTGDLVDLLGRALVDEPPASVLEGGLIRDGYDPELDRLRLVSTGGRDWIAKLQVDERERTGISSLKVGFNQVFGYYIEISKPNLERVPEGYIRKQTLANAERFVTPALKEREEEILKAQELIEELEQTLFTDLRDEAARWSNVVRRCAATLAQIDVLCCLAQVAETEGWVRPDVDDGLVIDIEAGRHPVVERQLQDGRFVPNDMRLDHSENQLLLITGPNMAGKSTIIRQVGIIVILAQIGSFVPARRATIGIVDRLFTRVGASDNLSRGESTYMVEMNEASTILNNVSDRSLVLIDELGRGTSTFDGLSIAWAIIEHLHDGAARPRTLFATHYHELTALEQSLAGVKNMNVQVREEAGRIVFLHRMVAGPCDQSYGINVAQMAGIPAAVVRRAVEILAELESGAPPHAAGEGVTPRRLSETTPQMDLFGQGRRFADELADELASIDVSSTTPIEALLKLEEWKRRIAADPRDGSEQTVATKPRAEISRPDSGA